jgi:hypothetical protein
MPLDVSVLQQTVLPGHVFPTAACATPGLIFTKVACAVFGCVYPTCSAACAASGGLILFSSGVGSLPELLVRSLESSSRPAGLIVRHLSGC